MTTSPAHDHAPSAPDNGAAPIEDALRRTFGHADFRPGQREVVERLLAGRPVLAVFPTGAGKSLCFQLPALRLPGLTLVISPLIALMKDQVDALVARGVAAARLDSSLDAAAARAVYAELESGRLKILYVAPERLGNERFLRRLGRTRISLLAIDEAHCISEWGHNFRPDYLRLARLAREIGVERVLALTATATPAVAADVREAFGIAAEDHVQTGFHRPNLELVVTRCTAAARTRHLAARLAATRGPAIVYVTLQRTAEEVAEALAVAGISARAYHAGMEDEERTRVQDAFMRDDVRVVVATIAFGMGIDKADIRAVYHFNLPKTLENYAQEVGRAGRDGAPARCELLACGDDVVTLAGFVHGDRPTREALDGLVAEVLAQGEVFAVAQHELSARYDVRPLVVSTALTYLELDGLIAPTAPFYTGYQFQPVRSFDEILERFDPARRALLGALFAHAKAGRTWHSVDSEEAARALGEPRQRIVTAIGWLEEQGELVVRATGLRHGFRRLVAQPDVAAAVDALDRRFEERETRDVARIEQVVAWAEAAGCRTAALVGYFGETLDGPCGHCSGCAERANGDRAERADDGRGVGAVGARGERADDARGRNAEAGRTESEDGARAGEPLPRTPRPPLGAEARSFAAALHAERHRALAHPRQLARFLVGLSSPATTRAKLHRDPRFGRFGDHPFPAVLALCEEVARGDARGR